MKWGDGEVEVEVEKVELVDMVEWYLTLNVEH